MAIDADMLRTVFGWVLAAIVFVGFPSMIAIGLIPFSYRFYVLAVGALVLLVYAVVQGWSLERVGVRLDNIGPALVVNAGLIVILGGSLILGKMLGVVRGLPDRPSWIFGLFYVFVSCPAQEFAYRAFIFEFLRERRLACGWGVMIVSVVLYAFAHVIYGDIITLLVAIGMGVVWGGVYSWLPNIVGVSMSHAALGLLAFELGLV
jgi:membrane protease YdiL (CAAX protease family)